MKMHGLRMATIVLICLSCWSCSSLQRRAEAPETDTGLPFGAMTDEDVDRFRAWAQQQGVDIATAMNRAEADEPAGFDEIFRTAGLFRSLDMNAAIYGNILYSLFLRKAEANGCDRFGASVDAQPSDIQQRVRDFLYYPVQASGSAEVEREARTDCPRLFPKKYRFAQSNSIFRK
jgi:hypothetical protein